MGPTKVSQHLNSIWEFSFVFSLWQILDVICTFFIHPEHYVNATLFQRALQIYCTARFSLEWWTCSASVLVQYVVLGQGEEGLVWPITTFRPHHGTDFWTQKFITTGKLHADSEISSLKEEVLKQGMKNMSKGFIFVVVCVGLCQLCFISREVNKNSYNSPWKRRWTQSSFTNFVFVKF